MVYIESRRKTPPGQDRPGQELHGRRESSELPVSETDRKIEQAIAYMLQHLNKQLHVAKLASLVNVSPSHFFALFKRQTGCAPIDFFIRLRMQHACQLLDGTSLNVKEVAAVLGYDDPFYFSRTFKAVNQVAPSEYRMLPRQTKDAVRNVALPSAIPGTTQSNALSTFEAAAPARERAAGGTEAPISLNPVSKWINSKESNGRILHGKDSLHYPGKENFCHKKGNGSYAPRS